MIARFVSADPHVQDLYRTQNLNRYAYVLNNPLAYTDPDGFFFKKIFRAVKRVFKAVAQAIRRSPILRVAVTVGLAYFGAPLIGLEALGLGANVLSSAIVGGITDGVEGAAFGAARAAVTFGIGDHIGSLAGRVVAHSVTSGAFAAAQGGEFGPSALAAGFSVGIGGFADQQFNLNSVASFVSHSTIGGTAAVIGGGKFQNGAATAAFVWAARSHALERRAARSRSAVSQSAEVRVAALGAVPVAAQAARAVWPFARNLIGGIATALTGALKGSTGYELIYRVHGGLAGQFGRSWTPIDPRTVPNYRNAAGLPDSNTGDFLTQGHLIDRVGVEVRNALPLDGNRGGLTEYVVPRPTRQIEVISTIRNEPPF